MLYTLGYTSIVCQEPNVITNESSDADVMTHSLSKYFSRSAQLSE